MTPTRSHNRIAAHFDAPAVGLPDLPTSARERGKLWSDTVFQAVLALRRLLTSRDESVVAAAVDSILDLERTRMRHGKLLAGSESVSEAQEEFEAEQRLDLPMPVRKGEPQPPTGADASRPETPPEIDPLFLLHAEEVFDEMIRCEAERPAGERTPVTMERAMGFVEWQLARWDMEARDIPTGRFMRAVAAAGRQ